MTAVIQADTEKHEGLSLSDPFPYHRYRGPLQQIVRILSIAKKPCLFIHIHQATGINYPRLKPYLSSLIAAHLLGIVEEKDCIHFNHRWNSKQRVYMTTDRGIEFLQLYKELDDFIHLGKTELDQSTMKKKRLQKFHDFLRKRAQDPYTDLEAFRTDQDVQVQVLVEGRRAVNLEDVRQASENKRTITVILSHREYQLFKKEAQIHKRSYPDLIRRMVRHYFGFKGSGCWRFRVSKKHQLCTPLQ